jgi:membrane dipeptidase
VLDKLKKNNGIIMISFVPRFTNANPEAATVYHVVNHIMHAADRIGFDHIGVGSDFDGMETVIEGLEDASQFPNLFACLLERGVAAANIEKILGRNALRVLNDVETVAERLKSTPALQDKVHDVWSDEERRKAAKKHPKCQTSSKY